MFALRIKELRKESKKTQEEMAKILGVAKTTYASYEQAKRMPDAEIQNKIANYFDVSLDYLHGRSRHKNINAEGFTPKEEIDMKKRMDALREDLKNEDGLLYDGEPITTEAMESILDAMEFAEKQATRINRKYAPKDKKNNIE
ncbi:helix-turn-helix transcriptional regulator [Listeria monocytogenes]|nr:XRE family transcriptional regulator [Listeria monocytogenes]EAH2617393.1 XRE family transcriptional regulator [Listeria monocytogenes]EFO5394882.1 helix-turn-helix transcriptional regulator [Listeria monocytogenes]EFO5683943.1 helix-turn-helix transcriptional regulator [Listeria monocytogenes]EFO5709439.1 helix-turn-helix transcriptional regulator [Listeria monocytogenes]